jgi:hypothetical protein
VLLQQGVPHGRRVLVPVLARHGLKQRMDRLPDRDDPRWIG